MPTYTFSADVLVRSIFANVGGEMDMAHFTGRQLIEMSLIV